jgi:hypothetical protein
MASIAEDRRAASEVTNAGGVLSAPDNDGDSQLMLITPASHRTRCLYQAPTETPENQLLSLIVQYSDRL